MGLSFTQYMELGKFVVDSLGGLGEGAAQGRVQEGDLAVKQGQLELNRQELAILGARYANDANLQRYVQQLNAGELDLRQRQFQLDAPNTRMLQVMRGDLLANPQDVQIEMPSDVPEFNFTGGLKPSALGPNSRAFGRELSRQALINQMPSGVATTTPTAPAPPRMTAQGRPYEGSIQQVIDQGRGNSASAQTTATADPASVAGGQSPLVGGRVVPRGDAFAPIAPPPPVVGFGGPMGGAATTGGAAVGQGDGTVGPLRGGDPRTSPRLRGIGGRGAEIGTRGMEGYARSPEVGSGMTGAGQTGTGDPRNGLNVMGLIHPGAAGLVLIDKLFGGKLLGPRGGAEEGGGAEWGPPSDLAYNPQDMSASADNQYGWNQPAPGYYDPNLRGPFAQPGRNRAAGSSWVIPQVE